MNLPSSTAQLRRNRGSPFHSQEQTEGLSHQVAQRGSAANGRADGRVLPSAGLPGVWVACESPVFEDSPRGQTARLSAPQLRNRRSLQRNQTLVVQAFSLCGFAV